jgi:succinoglycan biosynthesis protein ExoV
MRLYAWRGAARNFGDELNHLLWPSLLPGLVDDPQASPGRFDGGKLDDDPLDGGPLDDGLLFDEGQDLFLGIGSVLDARHSPHRRKIVAGAGFGGYERPASLDGSWEIHWVRGPRTAHHLGLPRSFGLGDPASLLPLVHPVPRHDTGTNGLGTIGFMPHFESLGRGAWHAVAAAAGVTLIDPRGWPYAVIDQIAGCRVLLSEALHGVIVADAMRVPWVALMPLVATHRAKWLDWANTLDLTIRFQALAASSPRERIEVAFIARRRLLRAGIAHAAALAQRFDHRSACLDRAAAALRRAAEAPPQLSLCQTLQDAQERMLNRLHTLRAGRGAKTHAARNASHRLLDKAGAS